MGDCIIPLGVAMRKNEHVHMSKGKLERWTMCGKTLNKHPHMLISKDVKKVSCGRCLDCIRRQELSKSRKREGTRLKKQRRIVFSLWREAVWLIWDGKCALCGRPTNNLNSHHFFPKGAHSALEFEPYCGVLLCYGCHIGKVHRGGDVERLRKYIS